MDYCFMRDADSDPTLTCLVCRDQESRVTFADVCPRKGTHEHSIDQALLNLKRLGHSKMVIKTDQEPALVSLADNIKARREQDTILEHSPVAESAANGIAEKAVQQVEERVRVLKLGLQRRISSFVPTMHPIMTWLIQHAGDMLSKLEVGADGRTPYERLRGKRYRGEVVEFGSIVHYRVSGALQPGRGKLEPRWREGVWLGKRWESDEHLISTPEGVMKCRAIAQVPQNKRWSNEAVNSVRGVPWAWKGEEDLIVPKVVFAPHPVEPETGRTVPENEPRNMKITVSILEKHGYTATCDKCRSLLGTGPRTTKAHDATCRQRIEAKVTEDDEFRIRLTASKLRKDDYATRMGEAVESDRVKRLRSTSENPVGSTAGGGVVDMDVQMDGPQVSADAPTTSTATTTTAEGGSPPSATPPTDTAAAAASSTSASSSTILPPRSAPTTFSPSAAMPSCPPPSSSTADGMDSTRRKRARSVGDVEVGDGPDDDHDMSDEESAMHILMSMGIGAPEARNIVSEIYSPPRVTDAARRNPSLGIRPGFALDLTTSDDEGRPWDFDDPSQRAKAKAVVLEKKPQLLIGSPMCTAFSCLQALNWGRMSSGDKERMLQRARVHLHFCMKLYELQRQAGRYFAHEHPASATSWTDPEVKKLMKKPDVETTIMHMCQYGMTCKGPDGVEAPVLKPTKWMSNSPALLSRLSRTCTRGTHVHTHLVGGRAAGAAIYPPNLCVQILRGFRDQLRHDQALAGQKEEQIDEMADVELSAMDWGELNAVDWVDDNTIFYDDVTGEVLDRRLVLAARQEEIQFYRKKQVYDVADRAQARAETGRDPISIRWVYVNKGDAEKPDIRARLVAREIRTEVSDGSMYAATPPLEALKWLLSLASSSPHLVGTSDELKVSFVDARRAYFNAKCNDTIFVELPFEERRPGACGKLKHWMYGTRGAASKWEEHYSQVLISAGFVKGKASPCTFYHPIRQLRCVVHGDDFTTLGRGADLTWFENMLQRAFEVEVRGRLGGGKTDVREIRILNRIARRTAAGFEWESDPRHAEIIIEQMGLKNSAPTSTPGTKERGNERDEEELTAEEATAFRGMAARSNFMAMDRADVQYTAKEICRRMAKPRKCDWAKLKRLARYLHGAPRKVQRFDWQQEPATIRAMVDTDYAGCLESRRSTSGGALLHGHHCLRTWSSTQKVVALSSGEAELYGIVKGAAESLGFQSIARDMGVKLNVEVYSDSSAARGMVRRTGIGKVRHIHVQELWVQEALKNEKFVLKAISGATNTADILTKYVDKACLDKHCSTLGLEARLGRASSAPQMTKRDLSSATRLGEAAAEEECEDKPAIVQHRGRGTGTK